VGKVLEEVGKVLEEVGKVLEEVGKVLEEVGKVLEEVGKVLEEVEETILEDVTDTERKWKSQHHTHNWRPTPISKMNNSSPLHI
jgi:hypothetical protein